MRLSAKEITFKVAALPALPLPIRLRGGGLTYMMTCAEAVELANQLADAITDLRAHDDRRTP